eukprot:scaffold5153_cov21-Phaeocystis_antarctica.AAC.1
MRGCRTRRGRVGYTDRAAPCRRCVPCVRRAAVGTDVHDDRTTSAAAFGVTSLGHAAVLRDGGCPHDPDH